MLDVKPQTFLQLSTGKCLTIEEAPDGWGGYTDTFKLSQCIDTNCKSCQSNYRGCAKCKTSNPPWYSYNGRCVNIIDFPAAHVCDNSTYEAKSCISQGCNSCLLDYLECTKCNDPPEMPSLANPKYFLIEKTCNPCNQGSFKVIDHECHRICEADNCYISLKATKYLKTNKQVCALLSASIMLNKSIAHKVTLYSERSNINRDLQAHEYEISIINDVMFITLDLDEDEYSGAIMFDRVNIEEIPIRGDGNALAFFDYPIRWIAIYYLSCRTEKALTSASGTTAASTASAKAIVQLIIIT